MNPSLAKYRGVLMTSLLPLLLAACVLPPRSDAPATKPVGDSTLGLDGPTAPTVAEGWWQGFGDPQLDRLIAQSFERSPTLEQAVARLREARAQADAQIAGAYPSANLSTGATRVHLGDNPGLPAPLRDGYFWLGNFLGELKWDIDVWGRQAALIKQAKAQSQATQLDIESAKLMLAGSMAQAYVELYRSYALADVATREQAQRQDILDITQKRIAAGLDTRVELRQAEAALPQARVDLQQAQTAVELAKHTLAMLTGDGANAYAGIQRPQIDLGAVLPLPQQLPGNLLARRPDVLAARLQLQAADSARVAAKAAFYPTIELTGYAGWASIGLADLFEAPSQLFAIGPTIRLPLFDAGRLRANYRGATAQIDAAVADYNNTVLHAVQQTADQISQIDGLQHELADQQQSLDASEDAYRIAEIRYRAGLAGYLSVLNAETTVLSGRRAIVDLTGQLAVARVSLLLAVGGSFDPSTAAPATAAAGQSSHPEMPSTTTPEVTSKVALAQDTP